MHAFARRSPRPNASIALGALVDGAMQVDGLALVLDAHRGVALDAPEKADIAPWFSALSRLTPGLDDKACAAYAAGYAGWGLGMALAAFEFAGAGLPDLGAERWRFEVSLFPAGSTSYDDLSLTPVIAADRDEPVALLPPDKRRALVETLHAPLVERLKDMSGLSRGALWRLVADGVAYGYLHVGRSLGRTEEGIDAALSIVKVEGSPLYNRQTDFVEITVAAPPGVAAPPAREWYRARGGCCRYYTSPEAGGDYCSTCVMRDGDSRDRRLADHLSRTRFGQPAFPEFKEASA